MSQRFSLGVVIRAVGAGALALGSKAVALSKGGAGASGAFKGLTGLALGVVQQQHYLHPKIVIVVKIKQPYQ
ncbi:hypothetical protein Ndes2526B_g03572 [Nannochloris sp. 'desiccata']